MFYPSLFKENKPNKDRKENIKYLPTQEIQAWWKECCRKNPARFLDIQQFLLANANLADDKLLDNLKEFAERDNFQLPIIYLFVKQEKDFYNQNKNTDRLNALLKTIN